MLQQAVDGRTLPFSPLSHPSPGGVFSGASPCHHLNTLRDAFHGSRSITLADIGASGLSVCPYYQLNNKGQLRAAQSERAPHRLESLGSLLIPISGQRK